MNRSTLISKIARQTRLSQAHTEEVVNAFVDIIIECLKNGEKVTISGLGRFEMRERKSKSYTNPKTKTKSQLPSARIPGFKASGLLKKKIAGK